MSAVIDKDAEFIRRRSEALFSEQERELLSRTNRVFFGLFLAQWVFAIFIAVAWSPYGWEGKVRSTNVHVPAAILLGGLISSLPLALLAWRPHATVTRHVVAIAQMLWSALLIHLSGGRIETHFHVFGSLAFLAFYRDWRILVTATVVVAGDHLARGLFWAESVYGIANPEWWRFIEHAGWVVFEDVILVMGCLRAQDEMRSLARGRAEVESQQRALVRTEKLAAIGELAASIGHELRNPLSAIKGAMDYLGRRMVTLRPNEPVESDPRVKAFVDLVGKELGSCDRVIEDLLDFARERPAILAPCPLRALAADAIAIVPVAPHVEVVNSVPDTLAVPSLDRDQFRRVLSNLVRNAVEALDAAPGRVEITAHGGGDSPWTIRVTDDGPGIPADVLPKVFAPLFTTKTTGTGLGLAIVANMVERHGGRIDAKSEPGKGTTFEITLPAAGAALRQAA